MPYLGLSLMRRKARRSLAVFVAMLGCAISSQPANAEEPVDQFLNALRNRGMHDTVILYLENLKGSDQLTDELRDRVEYEIGLAHLEVAKLNRDPAEQVRSLQAAQQAFDQFLQAQGNHPQAIDARMQLGVVKLWRGRNVLRLAERLPDSEQATRNAEARTLFGEAEKIFANVKSAAETRVEQFPEIIDSSQRELLAERNAVRDAIVRAQIYDAESSTATADSYPTGSAEWEAATKAAGQKYVAIGEKYAANSAGGFLARRGSAESLLALGNRKEALGIYQSLINMADVGEYVQEQQTLLLPKMMELMCSADIADFEGALALGEVWLQGARGAAGETPTGLAIHYWMAQAQHLRIEAIRADETRAGTNSGQREIREFGNALLEHAEVVASRRGDYQRKGRELLIAYRGAEEVRPTTFFAAREAGQSALDYFQELVQLPPTESTAEELEQREADKAKSLTEAIDYFRLALTLGADGSATPDELNYTRYFLCYSHFHHGDFYDAAVIGQFVAHKEPTFDLARACAQLGLESFRQIYFIDKRGNREFQQRQLEQMASLIAEQWPNSEDSDAAWMLLADLAIGGGDYPLATDYLDKISADSPRKGLAILKAGQAVWGQYAAQSRPESDASEEELNTLLQRAENGLSEGVQKARASLVSGEPVPYDLLAAEISLAQLYSRTDRIDEAVELLLRDQGVTDSLRSGIAGASPQFTEIAYRTALRCFVQAGNIDAALEVMQQLNQRALGNEQAQRELTAIYLSLGNDLSQQLTALQKDPAKRQQLADMADGFQGVLNQIANKPEGVAFNELYWVANTYTTLGRTLSELDAEKSRDCYESASTLFERLLADPNIEDKYRTPFRVRLAESYRHMGSEESLQQGINMLLAVLNENENFVDAQQEANMIFERWGDLNHQASFYDLAINGYQDPQSKRRLVWGWGAFAAKVQRSETYRDKYHLARLNVAECRFKKAMTKSGDERKKLLEQARGDIGMTMRIADRTLGGEPWRTQYDSLLKTIQRELQTPQIGLKYFEDN